MRIGDLLKLSTRMFKARTSRTLLTIFGMSVGIGAILFLVSFGYGLQKTLLERITTAESLLTLDVMEAKSGLVNLNGEMAEKIKNISGVEEVSPALQISAQGRVDDTSSDLTVKGARPSFLRLGGITVAQGETINDENKTGVLFSASSVEIFGIKKEDAASIIGKEVSFSFLIPKEESDGGGLQSNFEKIDSDKKYTVIGIVDGEEAVAYVHLDSLAELKIERFSQLKVKCASQAAMGNIRDQILEQGLLVSSLSETVEQADKIFGILQIILMLFGIIALIVSAIGMFNTMTIALLERTEEIGIMKSIGASDGAVSMMFIMEATIMGFLGGLGGVLLGIVGGKIFNLAINFIAARFGGEAVNLFDSPLWFIATIIIFAAVVGFITGVIPARRASKIDPLDALRYK